VNGGPPQTDTTLIFDNAQKNFSAFRPIQEQFRLPTQFLISSGSKIAANIERNTLDRRQFKQPPAGTAKFMQEISDQS
jgi:hypothetical protein